MISPTLSFCSDREGSEPSKYGTYHLVLLPRPCASRFSNYLRRPSSWLRFISSDVTFPRRFPKVGPLTAFRDFAKHRLFSTCSGYPVFSY